LAIKVMCGIFFQKVDHIDCKIIAFKVKKIVFLHFAKLGSADFEFPWLNLFSLFKFEIFGSKMSWESKKNKSQKRVIFVP
jgi:hypothetical protein